MKILRTSLNLILLGIVVCFIGVKLYYPVKPAPFPENIERVEKLNRPSGVIFTIGSAMLFIGAILLITSIILFIIKRVKRIALENSNKNSIEQKNT